MFLVGAGGSYTVGQVGGVLSQTASTDSQGNHSHGGADGAAGSHSHTGSVGSYALTVNDIPAHTHSVIDSGHSHGIETNTNTNAGTHGVRGGDTGPTSGVTENTDPVSTNIAIASTGGGAAHSHTIGVDGSHAHTISIDGSHTHSVPAFDNRPPFYALCFIMKL
jgi:hypothetical protein